MLYKTLLSKLFHLNLKVPTSLIQGSLTFQLKILKVQTLRVLKYENHIELQNNILPVQLIIARSALIPGAFRNLSGREAHVTSI